MLDTLIVGLDSSVTFDIVKALRGRSRSEHVGFIIALLQPTPETVALFDDVVLMREGAVVFHGPLASVQDYLRGLGFRPPMGMRGGADMEASSEASAVTPSMAPTIDLADWLTELLTFPARRHRKDLSAAAASAAAITSSDGTPAIASPEEPKSDPPLTTADLVAAWKAHPMFERLMADSEVGAATTSSSIAPSSKEPGASITVYSGTRPLALESEFARSQFSKAYVHTHLHHARSVLSRQFKLLMRNKLFVVYRIVSSILMVRLFSLASEPRCDHFWFCCRALCSVECTSRAQ